MTRFASLFLLAAALLPAEDINKPAPELEIKMENGSTLKLSSLKGKPVLMEVFRTSCPHCQHAAPILEKALRTYSPKGLQLIAIATDDSERLAFAEFRQKYGATYPMGIIKRDDSYRFFNMSVMTPFYVPTLVFIDKAGIVRERFIGGLQSAPGQEEADLNKHIEALLKPATAAKTAVAVPTRAAR